MVRCFVERSITTIGQVNPNVPDLAGYSSGGTVRRYATIASRSAAVMRL